MIRCPHCDGDLDVRISRVAHAADAGCPDACGTCGEALNPNEILSSALHDANERDWALEAKERKARVASEAARLERVRAGR